MCGFLGQYSPQQIHQSEFLANLAIAEHRGPDQRGYWQGGDIQLGFNRLAIVDLTEAGHQPMLCRSGDWAVVFNGEIYNHQELRKALASYPFRGHSDTETLVASLEAHGFEETVKKLIGMFAIAAWHKPTKTLYATRDSVGIKPFFYSATPQNLWFASQFDQVIKGLGKEKVSLYPEGMRDYMQFGYMQAPNTIYKQIKQLLPGEMMVVNADGLRLQRIISYPKTTITGPYKDTEEKALLAYNQLFSAVVKDQLQADVPVSTFLSSGIDSSLVTAFAHRHKKDLSAFTIGLSQANGDERPIAAQYARHLKVKHITRNIEHDELTSSLKDHFQKLGEPFADFSSIPTYLICRKARENSTVMLSGDGGDELFWGYDRMLNMTQSFPFFKDKLIVRRIKKKLKIFPKPEIGAIYEFENAENMVQNAHSHIPLGQIANIFQSVKNTPETVGLYHFSGSNQQEFRDWLRYNEFYAHMQRVLIKVDRMSMAHSLEVRVPLLDQRIVQFAWSLASEFGLDKTVSKKAFSKKALAQFIPSEMMNKKKMGFYIPIGDWLKSSLKEDVQELLLNQPILGEEYIDRKAWNGYVNEFYSGSGNNEWGIWIMYCWQKWAQHLSKL